MKIHIVNYSEGAAVAEGLAVVIDVFRAFSTACYAFEQGAKRIIATHSLEKARELRKDNPQYMLMGERHARKPVDFDFGNSPSEIKRADLSGKTLVQTTHAGTRALLAARKAEHVITGSFVNAGAIVRYLRNASPGNVFLICAGFEGVSEATEDSLCAQYIRDTLLGYPHEFDAIRKRLETAPSALRFFDPDDQDSLEIDFHMCLALDRFDFVIARTHADADTCLLEPYLSNMRSFDNRL
jgi:2-phosphosulfolactate phosphatase